MLTPMNPAKVFSEIFIGLASEQKIETYHDMQCNKVF